MVKLVYRLAEVQPRKASSSGNVRNHDFGCLAQEKEGIFLDILVGTKLA